MSTPLSLSLSPIPIDKSLTLTLTIQLFKMCLLVSLATAQKGDPNLVLPLSCAARLLLASGSV
jgi:hypothetical protein